MQNAEAHMGQDCTQMLKNDVVVKMEDNPLSLIEGLSGGSPLPLSLSAGIGLRPFSDNELEIKDVSRHM